MENQNPEEARVEQMIDELMRKAKIVSQEYMKLDQETVDNITKAMSMAGLEHHMELAKMAVEETGRGIYEDKITKNMFATEYVYHSIKHEKTVGIIKENDEDGYVEIAEPVGIIAGVTPVTNPTSTTMFKSIIAAKTRNVIVFGFHPSAQKCSVAAATILRDAAVKAGAPENCILWVEEPSILATRTLMNHPDVNLIYAANEGGTVGATMAVKNVGKAGSVYTFGIDANEQLANMLLSDDNILQATTGQDSYTMGYNSMKDLISSIKGEETSIEEGTTEYVDGMLLERSDEDGINDYLERLSELSK